MKTFAMPVAVALLSFAVNGTAHAGWFKNATGIRTPEPIRKIAPRGIQLPRPRETSSADTWAGESTTAYRISDDGSIVSQERYNYGGSSNWTRTDKRADLQYNSQGHAYWVYPAAENSPYRVQRYDRPQVPQLRRSYRSNYGSVYLSQQGNQVQGRIEFGVGRVGDFGGTIRGSQLILNWRNGRDHGRAWLDIDAQGNLAGSFRSDYNGQGGYWRLTK